MKIRDRHIKSKSSMVNFYGDMKSMNFLFDNTFRNDKSFKLIIIAPKLSCFSFTCIVKICDAINSRLILGLVPINESSVFGKFVTNKKGYRLTVYQLDIGSYHFLASVSILCHP